MISRWNHGHHTLKLVLSNKDEGRRRDGTRGEVIHHETWDWKEGRQGVESVSLLACPLAVAPVEIILLSHIYVLPLDAAKEIRHKVDQVFSLDSLSDGTYLHGEMSSITYMRNPMHLDILILLISRPPFPSADICIPWSMPV
mgnify:CR=1 FL=1